MMAIALRLSILAAVAVRPSSAGYHFVEERASAWPTCKVPGQVGQACSSGSCAAGLYCDDASKKCAASPGRGAPCGNGVACASGLGCAFRTGKCEALGGAGSQCLLAETGPHLCGPNLACYAGQCAAVRPDNGAPCSDFLNLCGPGFGCSFTGAGNVCRASAAVGQACTANTAGACVKGAYCDPKTLKCTALSPEGARCSDLSCAEGLSCLPSGLFGLLRCQKVPAKAGATCLDKCGAGLVCAP